MYKHFARTYIKSICTDNYFQIEHFTAFCVSKISQPTKDKYFWYTISYISSSFICLASFLCRVLVLGPTFINKSNGASSSTRAVSQDNLTRAWWVLKGGLNICTRSLSDFCCHHLLNAIPDWYVSKFCQLLLNDSKSWVWVNTFPCWRGMYLLRFC